MSLGAQGQGKQDPSLVWVYSRQILRRWQMLATRSISRLTMLAWQRTSQWTFRIDLSRSMLIRTLQSGRLDKIHRTLLLKIWQQTPKLSLSRRKPLFRTKLSCKWGREWCESPVLSQISTWKGRPYCRKGRRETNLIPSKTITRSKIPKITRADTQSRVETLAREHPPMEEPVNTSTKVPIIHRIRSVAGRIIRG